MNRLLITLLAVLLCSGAAWGATLGNDNLGTALLSIENTARAAYMTTGDGASPTGSATLDSIGAWINFGDTDPPSSVNYRLSLFEYDSAGTNPWGRLIDSTAVFNRSMNGDTVRVAHPALGGASLDPAKKYVAFALSQSVIGLCRVSYVSTGATGDTLFSFTLSTGPWPTTHKEFTFTGDAKPSTFAIYTLAADIPKRRRLMGPRVWRGGEMFVRETLKTFAGAEDEVTH